MNKKLIYKYLNNKASETEIQKIYNWIETSENNKQEFIALKKAWAMAPAENLTSKTIALKQLQAKIKKKPTFTTQTILKYAAAVVLLISVSFYFKNHYSNTPIENEVVLELGNGNTQKLTNTTTNKVITDTEGHVLGKQQANQIVYTNTEPITNNATYNTLKVPYGKTFRVVLSDSTIVHLNAGSTLKYPVQFAGLNNRKVTLTGEAFFEVTKDKAHPFIVETNNINIEVLGTKFNLSTYNNDDFAHCELMEGAVLVSETNNPKNTMHLAPNLQAKWSKTTKTFKLNTIDINNHISWIHGELIFKNMPFPEMLKKLERAYNVTITNNSKTLAQQQFTGSVNVKDDVTNILNLLKIDTPFNYSIKNKTIKITQPH
ncbi:FecR family protein [Seonamhaeicola algicola]|uniref:FecR family protein n=1 Tax=Seonamhaeicola algicola TaxID=1719036 RepID=A0A5C7AN12_9FLAO|nr:FecR family protein [Seonamhaeicola algicola]TXE09711.1 FecR family protein [Seonamhaeicola algicola]